NGGASGSRTSTTITRFPTPTCGAASPTPSAAYIVSSMSSMSVRTSSSTTATGSARARNTGSPRIRISRIAIEGLLLLRRLGREDARDLAPRNHDPRLARLERDPILRQMHDLAQDPAFR